MKILNLGCGAVRPGDPWINIDFGDHHAPAHNFINYDLRRGIPFPDNSADGIFSSHFFEHLDANEARIMMERIYHVLKPGGIVCTGVPNASYFRKVYAEDNRANSMRLFGEPIPDGDPVPTNLRRALYFHEHRQTFTEDSLWCLYAVSGFDPNTIKLCSMGHTLGDVIRVNFSAIVNRIPFTLFMEASK